MRYHEELHRQVSIRAERQLGKVAKCGGAHDKGRYAPLGESNGVVDTPRRAGSSIGEAGDAEVGIGDNRSQHVVGDRD